LKACISVIGKSISQQKNGKNNPRRSWLDSLPPFSNESGARVLSPKKHRHFSGILRRVVHCFVGGVVGRFVGFDEYNPFRFLSQ
jgi:hypothetical protein